MSRTRVFVPASFGGLGEIVGTSRSGGDTAPRLLPPGSDLHAVTDALRADFPDADDEELEYLAMTAAAQRSVEQVDIEGPYGRVVLAVDVDSVEAARSEDPTVVRVTGQVLLSDVVSAHVDSEDAAPDVFAARTASDDPARDADDALARCLDHELGWYAASELDEVVARAAGEHWRPGQ